MVQHRLLNEVFNQPRCIDHLGFLLPNKLNEWIEPDPDTGKPRLNNEDGKIVSAVIREGLDPIRIRAIVRFTGNRVDLEGMGLEVRSQAQDVFTLVGTRQQLRTLASQPACRRMRTPRILLPLVDEASKQAEIDVVHDIPRPPLDDVPWGYEGDGVLIGMIDTALDVTHHGFREPGTNDSRVLYYWVQVPDSDDAPGQTPHEWWQANKARHPNFEGLTYGRLYTRADINTALGLADPYGNGNNQISCRPDLAEHGTHCAGIAAGNGRGLDEYGNIVKYAHVGAAPRATIVYVRLPEKFGNDATFEDNIMDAINFCHQVARVHSRPIVISISYGSQWGPHNGSSDLDLYQDNLLNSFSKRSIVWGAGNDNNDQGYRRGSIGPASRTEFTLTSNRDKPIWLDIWSTGPELDYRITYRAVSSGWLTAGQDFEDTLSGQRIEVERDAEESGGNLHGLRMYFENAYDAAKYRIELRNPHATQTANYHAWSGMQGNWANLSGSSQNQLTLTDTACCKSILTVGGCGKIHPPNPAAREQIADLSGAGPTVDGRIKPEIVAVGGTWDPREPVMSTNSAYLAFNADPYVGKVGTSMATPLVAGAVALLHEAYEYRGIFLNQETVKALLIKYARQDDRTQPGHDEEEFRKRYGFGRLRLLGAVELMDQPKDVDLWVRTAADDYGEEPYPGGCFCGAPDIRVCHAGTNHETTEITWGATYDVKVTVHNLGMYDAVDTVARLKYTTPHTAPNKWIEAESAFDLKLVLRVTVRAMSEQEVVFHWRPEASEISAPAGQTHFCLLAEVDHPKDPLVFPAPTEETSHSAWATNIKGTNNIALQNLHIQ